MPEQISQSLVTAATRAPEPVSRRVPGSGQANGNKLPGGGKETPQEPAPPPLETAVKQINQYLADSRRNLVFEIDDQSGRTVIRVINPETQEVIREIPPKETRRLANQIATGDARILDIRA